MSNDTAGRARSYDRVAALERKVAELERKLERVTQRLGLARDPGRPVDPRARGGGL